MRASTAELVNSVDWRTSLRDARKGLVLKPLLANYLYGNDLPDFTMHFRQKHPLDLAAGDGWFHPSTHPLWSERQLYDYLVRPEELMSEPPDYGGTLSMLFGSAMHGFLAHCMGPRGLKILEPKYQKCAYCPPQARCKEPGVMDIETGARGHADGRLTVPGHPPGAPIWEFKSTGSGGGWKMEQVEDLDEKGFAEAWPGYYAQAQEYCRLTGARIVMLLMLGIGSPWIMREWHIRYDHHFAFRTRQKYMRVRQAVADQIEPRCSCDLSSRNSCPSRGLCTA